MPTNKENIEKSFQEAIEEKDKVLSLIYDTVGDVIFALDVTEEGDYVFNSVNKNFLLATGLKEDMVVGKSVKNVIPEPSLSLVLGKYKEAIESKSSVSWEEVTPYPTGVKVGEVRIAPVFDHNSSCTMLVGSVHDITEIRNYAVKLEGSMEKIAQKNYELEQMGYITSHDLQEPLNTIKSFCYLLESELSTEQLNENVKQYLKFINSASTRMKLLLDGVLDYNTIGGNSELVLVDLNTLVNECLDDLAGSILSEKAVVKVEELPKLKIHETEIRLLFQNLIGNAIKYKREEQSPEISISSEKKDDGSWYFEVRDNGLGIEEEHKDKIFHVFQRLHKKNEFEGSGIGLSICKKVVDLHEGKIWVESNSPTGSKFCFTLKSDL